MSRPSRLVAAAVAVALVIAGCGDDDAGGGDGESSAPSAPRGSVAETTATMPAAAPLDEAAFPVTIAAANGEVTIDQRPERVLSLSPVPTEMLFAVGAGEQVIAVDSLSNYPPEAPVTDLSAYEPNIEAIAGYEPDLVVLTDDINDVVSGLGALGIPVLQVPAATTLDDTYAQLEQVGAATGNIAGAAEVVADMQRRIDEIVASTPPPAEPLTYYHELDSTLYTVTSTTFIGEVYGAFGLVNIADTADPDGAGYPQLSAEFILDQDPALIFLADTKCCGESATTAAARPGWSELTAVRDGTVIELDDDIASRWGPRVVDFYAAISAGISKVPVA